MSATCVLAGDIRSHAADRAFGRWIEGGDMESRVESFHANCSRSSGVTVSNHGGGR